MKDDGDFVYPPRPKVESGKAPVSFAGVQTRHRAVSQPATGNAAQIPEAAMVRSTITNAALCACVFGLGVGCGQPGQQQEPQRGVQVFTAHAFLQGGAQTKPMGGDCSAHGKGDCAASAPICLHFDAAPSTQFACSKACEGQGDCPAGWLCQLVYPEIGSSFCVPLSTQALTANQ